MKILRNIMLALVLAGLLAGSMRPVYSLDLGSVLKIGGIVLAVTTFRGPINSFINKTLGQHDAAVVGATKVVPIISVGTGTYLGAAQVMGVPASVKQTQAVASVNVTLSSLSGSLLVPISTKTAGKSLARVSGVGVSAVISFHI